MSIAVRYTAYTRYIGMLRLLQVSWTPAGLVDTHAQLADVRLRWADVRSSGARESSFDRPTRGRLAA